MLESDFALGGREAYYSKAAAPMKTAAAKVVASNLRSDAAALKVGEGDDPPAEPVLEPELELEPEPELEPELEAEPELEVPVEPAEEPVWVAEEPEEAAVTKPVAVEEPEVPVAVFSAVVLEDSGGI